VEGSGLQALLASVGTGLLRPDGSVLEALVRSIDVARARRASRDGRMRCCRWKRQTESRLCLCDYPELGSPHFSPYNAQGQVTSSTNANLQTTSQTPTSAALPDLTPIPSQPTTRSTPQTQPEPLPLPVRPREAADIAEAEASEREDAQRLP
jgi:hypothetical protein